MSLLAAFLRKPILHHRDLSRLPGGLQSIHQDYPVPAFQLTSRAQQVRACPLQVGTSGYCGVGVEQFHDARAGAVIAHQRIAEAQDQGPFVLRTSPQWSPAFHGGTR